jgi:hypothetical protein
MIKFFRKIRQKLLPENKFSKYLIYAIGEITLVVIGILIALQVNNWNENKKERVQELKLLENFKKSLADDLNYRETSILTYNMARESIDYLISYMDSDLPYTDSLGYHFAVIVYDWGLTYDFSSYEELKSKGTSIISNESLRTNLLLYYSWAEGIGTSSPNRYSIFINNALTEIYPKHFDKAWPVRWVDNTLKTTSSIPNDYTELKKDKEFRFFLKSLRNLNYWLIEVATGNINQRYRNILQDLDNEIEKLKK